MKQWYKLLFVSVLGLLFAHAIISTTMRFSAGVPRLFTALTFIPLTGAVRDYEACGANLDVSLDWYPPPKTDINNLDKVIRGEGVHGFIFDTSDGRRNEYNYCNMPRVNPQTYPVPDFKYELEYVEILTRHHKRTPYAANTFPDEYGEWLCDDEMLFYGGEPTGENMAGSAKSYWSVYTTNSNPLTPNGYNGTCQFPQITSAGLVDSYYHGQDSRETYEKQMKFLPTDFRTHANTYRVTNNVITSQVASRFINGMWHGQTDQPVSLLVQPKAVDSLEPSYPCPAAKKLFASYGPGSDSNRWNAHLKQSAGLKKRLDSISGVDTSDKDWQTSWDRYFDNFSSRLCHQKPLPCSAKENSTDCVTTEDANQVFRLGQYEYSYIYRDSEESLRASVASFGIWVGELVQNFRSMMTDELSATEYASSSRVHWRHNIAHDGSIARMLSILQVNQMVWPGMGSELAFELFSTRTDVDSGLKCYWLRVLWGGQVLRSNHPEFGRMDMIPIGTFLAYIDGLVGVRGEKIPAMCSGTL